MAHFETTFGDIRSLAQRPADARAWMSFVGALVRARAGDDALAEYARGVAARWPDEARVAPAHVEAALAQGYAPPWLHLMRALSLGPEAASWIGRPELSGITWLTYDAGWGDAEDAVRRVLGGSFMRGLRGLTVTRARDGARVARVLAEGDAPERLVALTLRPARLGFVGARALVDSGAFARLEELALEDPRCGVAGARLILDAPSRLRTFASVGAPGFELGDGGVRALVEVDPGSLTSLTSLTLRRHAVGDAGARALAMSPLMSALRRLDLSENVIGASGSAALARALRGDQLLDLRGNGPIRAARRAHWTPR